MTAATAPRQATDKLVPSEFVDALMKGSTSVYQYTFGVLSAGFALAASTATGLIAVGRFRKNYDNSLGADGDLACEIEEGIFRWANAGDITQADIGKVCFLVDNQTVSKASSGKSPAGIIYKIDSYGVWVESSEQLSRALTEAFAGQATAGGAVPIGSVQTVTAVLVGGTVTITSLNVTAQSVIFAFVVLPDGSHEGEPSISAHTAGSPGSITVTSSNGLDTSKVRVVVVG